MVLIEEERQVATKELSERDTPRSLSGLLVGAVAGAANVVMRRVSGMVALRRSAARRGGWQIQRPRTALPLPNPYLAAFIAIQMPSFRRSSAPSISPSSPPTSMWPRRALRCNRRNSASATAGPRQEWARLAQLRRHSGDGRPRCLYHHQLHPQPRHSRQPCGKVDVRTIFRRPEADFWARLKDKASPEDLTELLGQDGHGARRRRAVEQSSPSRSAPSGRPMPRSWRRP